MRFGGYFIPMPVVVEWALPQPELRAVRDKLFLPADSGAGSGGGLLICTNKHALNYACGTTLLRRLKSEYKTVRAGFGASISSSSNSDTVTTVTTVSSNRASDDGGGGARYSDEDGLFIVTRAAKFSDRRFAKLGQDARRLKAFAPCERDAAIGGLIAREFPGFKPAFTTAFVPDVVGRAW